MSDKLNLHYTGNVFVDSGIYALMSYFKINMEEITLKHIKKLSEDISQLYVNEGWKKNMYSIFANNAITNPSTSNIAKQKYLKDLNTIIELIELDSTEGNCIACGSRNSVKYVQRNYIPLTGSKSLKNYFSFAEEGVDYCPLCLLFIQFSPLVMYRSENIGESRKNMILLHSNSHNVMKYWANKAIKNLNTQKITGQFTGCFNEGFTNPTNALFNIISNILESYEERWVDENPSLTFYYFTNFNRKAELEIYYLPNNVFKFLANIPPNDRYNWKMIIKNAYSVNWNKVKEFDEYKNYSNSVFNKLLNNKSILRFFYNFKSKKALCSWNLVKYYMREVQNMDEKRLEAIRNLGDNLSSYIKNNDKKKVLSSLENASNYNSFRNILRKIIKDKIANKDENLLFSFDDYVNNLFPEGNLSWRETQDLLLFRIYENLHSWLIEMNYVDEDIDEMEED